MRKRFEQQMTLGTLPIGEAKITTKKRSGPLLDHYMNYLNKFIDILDRRVLQGEQIPHEEKVFSIFEEYSGKCNKLEQAKEEHRSFKLLRNKHRNILPDVPPQSVVAMFDTVKEFNRKHTRL